MVLGFCRFRAALGKAICHSEAVKPARNLLALATDKLPANSRFLALLGMTNRVDLGNDKTGLERDMTRQNAVADLFYFLIFLLFFNLYFYLLISILSLISPLSFHFAHQCQKIVFAVTEKGHPQIMVGHARDHVRLVFEAHAFFFQPGMRGLDIGHGEVQNRTCVIELGLLRMVEHQANAIAIEERQAGWRFEQQLESENLFVEVGRAFHVVRANLNLSQPCDARTAIHMP